MFPNVDWQIMMEQTWEKLYITLVAGVATFVIVLALGLILYYKRIAFIEESSDLRLRQRDRQRVSFDPVHHLNYLTHPVHVVPTRYDARFDGGASGTHHRSSTVLCSDGRTCAS